MDYDKAADLYNDIGVAIVEQVGDQHVKALLYIQQDDGDFHLFLRFQRPGSDQIEDDFPNEELLSSVEELWNFSLQLKNTPQWRSIEYFLDDGKINIEITYSEDFKDHLSPVERSDFMEKKYF